MLADDEAVYGNGDRILNATDALYGNVRVWVDDGDGISETGELKTLTELGITNIDFRTATVIHDGRSINGNMVEDRALITYADGSNSSIHEVLFALRSADAIVGPEGVYLGNDSNLLALPQSRGYGELPSLQDAMANNSALKTMVEDFVATTDFSTINTQVEAILFTWAGVASAGTPGTPGYTAQKLEFMEKLFNEDWTGGTISAARQALFMGAWNDVFGMFKARLLAEGPLSSLFPHAQYDAWADKLTLGDTLETIMGRVEAAHYSDFGMVLEIGSILLVNPEGLGVTASEIRQTVGQAVADILGDADLATMLVQAMQSNANVIRGYGNFSGTDGSDVLWGSDGQDTINAGNGDTLVGGSGSDRFSGYGPMHDIAIYSGSDNPSDLKTFDFSDVTRLVVHGGDSRNLLSGYYDSSYISLGNGADSLTGGHFNASTIFMGGGNDLGPTGSDIHNSYVDLGDGNDACSTGANNTVYGGAGNDYIDGWSSSIYGGDGNDYLMGGYISQLFGDAGNDTIVAGHNGTAISFATITAHGGDGDDIFSATSFSTMAEAFYGDDGNDTLIGGDHLGAGGRLSATLDGGAGDDSIVGSGRVTDLIYGGSGADIIYGDNVVADAHSEDSIDGGAGNDTIYGGAESALYDDDYIDGGADNDSIFGVEGNDTIYGGSGTDFISGGNGNDYIAGSTGNDTLQGGDRSDSYVFVTGDGNDVILDADGQGQIIIDGLTLGGGSDPVYVAANEWALDGHQLLLDGTTLTIHYASDVITVENFISGDLGISLGLEIDGTSGDDLLVSGIGPDTISGYDGQDTVSYADSEAGVNVNLATILIRAAMLKAMC